MNVLVPLFGKPKAIIAMAHLPATPGRALHDTRGGVEGIVDAVRRDVEILAASDVDGILFCNENDRPYRTHVGPETVATMTAVIERVAADISQPWGVDILWDPAAAISVAKATGAHFVREVFTGTYGSDFGLWSPDAAAALELRRAIDATEVKLFFNVNAEFAAPVAPRPLGLVARGAVFASLADAVCVSGAMTGEGVTPAMLREVKEAVGDVCVIANTGVTPDTVGELLSIADGVIVGTTLKVDGVTWNPIDPARVARLVEAAEGAGVWSPRSAVALPV